MSAPRGPLPRLVTGGGLRVDYLVGRDGRDHTGLMGSNALYAAVGAAVWDVRAGLWARVGRNYRLDRLRSLPAHGISLDGLVRLPHDGDHRTFYAYTPDGGRARGRPSNVTAARHAAARRTP